MSFAAKSRFSYHSKGDKYTCSVSLLKPNISGVLSERWVPDSTRSITYFEDFTLPTTYYASPSQIASLSSAPTSANDPFLFNNMNLPNNINNNNFSNNKSNNDINDNKKNESSCNNNDFNFVTKLTDDFKVCSLFAFGIVKYVVGGYVRFFIFVCSKGVYVIEAGQHTSSIQSVIEEVVKNADEIVGTNNIVTVLKSLENNFGKTTTNILLNNVRNIDMVESYGKFSRSGKNGPFWQQISNHQINDAVITLTVMDIVSVAHKAVAAYYYITKIAESPAAFLASVPMAHPDQAVKNGQSSGNKGSAKNKSKLKITVEKPKSDKILFSSPISNNNMNNNINSTNNNNENSNIISSNNDNATNNANSDEDIVINENNEQGSTNEGNSDFLMPSNENNNSNNNNNINCNNIIYNNNNDNRNYIKNKNNNYSAKERKNNSKSNTRGSFVYLNHSGQLNDNENSVLTLKSLVPSSQKAARQVPSFSLLPNAAIQKPPQTTSPQQQNSAAFNTNTNPFSFSLLQSSKSANKSQNSSPTKQINDSKTKENNSNSNNSNNILSNKNSNNISNNNINYNKTNNNNLDNNLNKNKFNNDKISTNNLSSNSKSNNSNFLQDSSNNKVKENCTLNEKDNDKEIKEFIPDYKDRKDNAASENGEKESKDAGIQDGFWDHLREIESSMAENGIIESTGTGFHCKECDEELVSFAELMQHCWEMHNDK